MRKTTKNKEIIQKLSGHWWAAIQCTCQKMFWWLSNELGNYLKDKPKQAWWLGRLDICKKPFPNGTKPTYGKETHMKRERKSQRPKEDEKRVVVFCLSIPYSFCMEWQKFGLVFVLNSANFFHFSLSLEISKHYFLSSVTSKDKFFAMTLTFLVSIFWSLFGSYQ